jgi:chitin disaccharide deacetylase
MAAAENHRRLIVTADDFGRSTATNQAVIRAHQEGIVTCASLLVNGGAFEQAVELSHRNPRLGVGLHLCLLRGCSELKPSEIPGLVNEHFRFSHHPVRTGLRYFFRVDLRRQLRQEIMAQLEKFRRTGLTMDHLNGHLNIHLHPTICGLITRMARAWSIHAFRLTQEPLGLDLRLASGRWVYRLSHALVFACLSRRARPVLDDLGIRHTQRVFGLLQSGRVTEDYLARLLPRLPAGDSELYSHPSLDKSEAEFAALASHRIQAQVQQLGIKLVRYQDL